MVVEGANRRRLAVECDGDRYHGPEQWRQDMRRQRVLERVGWRFWRCFASSFYRDPDGVMSDLVGMLSRMGIEPMAQDAGQTQNRFTEFRTISAPDEVPVSSTQAAEIDEHSHTRSDPLTAVGLGDKVVLFFAETNKRLSARLFEDGEDLEKGRLSIHSLLGRVVCNGEEGDEIEFSEGGQARKVLIESVERSLILEINSKIERREVDKSSRPAAAVG
jgi:hypothetical protein